MAELTAVSNEKASLESDLSQMKAKVGKDDAEKQHLMQLLQTMKARLDVLAKSERDLKDRSDEAGSKISKKTKFDRNFETYVSKSHVT